MTIDKWHEKAMKGSVVAQGILGDAYLWGKGVTPNYEKALEWLELAASKGVATSLFNLGYMYENGLGVDKNIEKAIEYYKKAAKSKDQDASLSLGTIYYNGDGVDIDKEEAVKWFNEAFKLGPDLSSRTGNRFLNGYGLPKLPNYAYLWYKMAKIDAENMIDEISSNMEESEIKELDKFFNKLIAVEQEGKQEDGSS